MEAPLLTFSNKFVPLYLFAMATEHLLMSEQLTQSLSVRFPAGFRLYKSEYQLFMRVWRNPEHYSYACLFAVFRSMLSMR